MSFLVVDESDRTLSGWKVTSFKDHDNEVAAQFSGLTGTQIPRGFYQYVLTRTVPFVRANWTPTLHGKVEPMPTFAGNFDPVRIHIHPINPWSNVDVKVDPSGEFRIYEGLSGLCVLTVLRGEEVLHVEPIIFQSFHSASFVLRIADKPHPILHAE